MCTTDVKTDQGTFVHIKVSVSVEVNWLPLNITCKEVELTVLQGFVDLFLHYGFLVPRKVGRISTCVKVRFLAEVTGTQPGNSCEVQDVVILPRFVLTLALNLCLLNKWTFLIIMFKTGNVRIFQKPLMQQQRLVLTLAANCLITWSTGLDRWSEALFFFFPLKLHRYEPNELDEDRHVGFTVEGPAN